MLLRLLELSSDCAQYLAEALLIASLNGCQQG